MSGYSGKWSPAVRRAVEGARRARARRPSQDPADLADRLEDLQRERAEEAGQARQDEFERWLDSLGPKP